MAMQVRHIFGALAVSAAAAMLAACGQSLPTPVDPARPAIAPIREAAKTGNTVNPKTLLVQPDKAASAVAIPAPPPTYPVVKPGEILSAETFLNRGDARSNDSIASPVKSLAACLNIARERTYANDINNSYTRTSVTSCIGEDGTARARFACFRAGTGETACHPI